MTIDWAALRERGAEGLRTADVTDALIETAKNGVGFIATENGYLCPLCNREGWDFEHAPDCPIRILEEASGEQ